MKKPAKTAKHPPKVAHVVIQKNAKLLLKSHNPNMTKVLDKLHAKSLDGVSEILGKVRWMSRMQAKSFASFFGHSDFDAINSKYFLSLNVRKTGRPSNERITPELASYQRGSLVARMIKQLEVDARESGKYHLHITAKMAATAVIDSWPFLHSGKPPQHSSLIKDFSYFGRVEKMRNGTHLFRFPSLPVKQKKTK